MSQFSIPEKYFLEDPELADKVPLSYLSHKEKYEETVRKISVVVRKSRELKAKTGDGVDHYKWVTKPFEIILKLNFNLILECSLEICGLLELLLMEILLAYTWECFWRRFAGKEQRSNRRNGLRRRRISLFSELTLRQKSATEHS